MKAYLTRIRNIFSGYYQEIIGCEIAFNFFKINVIALYLL
jgi:hypothetical protein